MPACRCPRACPTDVKLDSIQSHFEAIYGLSCELKASDCLIDGKAAESMGGGASARREALWVHEDEDGLALGLFLAPEVLEALRGVDGRPGEGFFRAYLEAAEGVSHFLYVQHTAREERQVSLLELETQAEIDKFAGCALASWGGPVSPESWLGRLFDRVRYLEGLSEEEGVRYREANRLAKSYCRRLLPLVRGKKLEALLVELRKSYRLGAEAKLQYLSR